MAVFSMRVEPNVAISRALGFNPQGVLVDNISPYWLYFPQADAYCPPFTAGWSAPFKLNKAGYGYMQVQTPFGRTVQTDVNTLTGQYVEVTWTDDETTFNPGQPSNNGITVDPGIINETAVSGMQFADEKQIFTTLAPQIYTLIASPGTNKRIRIYSMGVFLDTDKSSNRAWDSAVRLILSTTGATINFETTLAFVSNLEKDWSFGNIGLDLPVGEGLRFMGSSTFADVNAGAYAVYQLQQA